MAALATTADDLTAYLGHPPANLTQAGFMLDAATEFARGYCGWSTREPDAVWTLIRRGPPPAGRGAQREDVISATPVYTGPDAVVPVGSQVTAWASIPHQRTARVITTSRYDQTVAWSHLEIALT